jgi:hypothetical protein
MNLAQPATATHSAVRVAVAAEQIKRRRVDELAAHVARNERLRAGAAPRNATARCHTHTHTVSRSHLHRRHDLVRAYAPARARAGVSRERNTCRPRGGHNARAHNTTRARGRIPQQQHALELAESLAKQRDNLVVRLGCANRQPQIARARGDIDGRTRVEDRLPLWERALKLVVKSLERGLRIAVASADPPLRAVRWARSSIKRTSFATMRMSPQFLSKSHGFRSLPVEPSGVV